MLENESKRGRRGAELKKKKEIREAQVLCCHPPPFLTHNKCKVKQVQGVSKQHYYSGLTRHEASRQRKRQQESEVKKTAKLQGLRRGIHHAEDKFLEPVQGIWSYACRSDRAGREEKEGKINSEKEKKA